MNRIPGKHIAQTVNIRQIIQKTATFWILYFIAFIAALVLLLVFSKATIHLWINRHNTPFADHFFVLATFIGNGIFSLLAAVVLSFFSLRKSLTVLSAWMISGLLVQLLKQFVFSSALRPVSYFRHLASLHLVDGVTLFTTQSFPSGHTASAFALFLCLAYFSDRRMLQGLFFALAFTVAYSRMYLSEHFLVDVTGGSVLGLGIACLFIYLFSGKWSNFVPDRPVYHLGKK